MTGKLIAAAVVGLVFGVAGSFLVMTQGEARGQEKQKAKEKKKQQWEYQVVYSSTEGKEAAKTMTARYNAFAADGWEYVGPVIDYTQAKSPNHPTGPALASPGPSSCSSGPSSPHAPHYPSAC